MMPGKDRARTWMEEYLEDYRDDCGEINCTSLSEDCCFELDLYKDTGKDFCYERSAIPDWIFDMAVDVMEEMEKKGEIGELEVAIRFSMNRARLLRGLLPREEERAFTRKLQGKLDALKANQ